MKTYVLHISKKGRLEHLLVRADEIRLKTSMRAINNGRVTCVFDSKSVQAYTEFNRLEDAEAFIIDLELKRHWVAKALIDYYKEYPIKEAQHLKENVK